MTTKQTLREIKKGGTSEMASVASSFLNRPKYNTSDIAVIGVLVSDYEQYVRHLHNHFSNEDGCTHCESR